MLSVLGVAERSEAADLVERLELLLDRVRDHVLREQFADCAVLTFRAGAVVADNIENDCVVANFQLFEAVDELADLRIDMLEEAGENLHQPRPERTLRLRNAVPRRHRLGARRQLRVRRNPAECLLPWRRPFTIDVPAGVELAFVFVGPLREDVVRAMRRARRPIHQEWLVGREGPVLVQPGDAPCPPGRSSDGILGSCGGSISTVFSTSRGSHCEVSPARKP